MLLSERPARPAMLGGVSQPLSLDEAINALRLDPTTPVLVKVDDALTVELRAVEVAAVAKKTMGELLREVAAAGEQAEKKTAADLFHEIGRWEGESGAELDALFARQRGNRQVPDLK